MATTKVSNVHPVLDQQTGAQRTWTNNEGKVNYIFYYALENGMRGEVMHVTPQPRFPVGTEVDATDTTKNPQYPKLKLEKPGGQQGGKGWSPEKQAQVEVQGLVQAAIASGARGPQIEALVREGMAETARITKLVLAHRQAQQPTPQPQTFHQPVQNPNPVQYRPDAPPTGSYPAPPPTTPYPAQQPFRDVPGGPGLGEEAPF